MIEIIADGQAKPRIKLPRNLRQIGSPNGEHRIYVEDFVYTFLHPSSQEETGDAKIAILVGKQDEEEGIHYYFIRGAFYIEGMEFEKGLPQFTEELWGYSYKQMKKYFDDEDPDKSLQILGWTFVLGGMPPRLTTEIERIHRMNFKEQYSLLLLLDDVEKEENFYVYEKGNLRKKEGYYIFYEQNPKMQEYMVQCREKNNQNKPTEEVTDEAAKTYREKIRFEEYTRKKHWNMIGYAACGVLVLSTLVMGINSIGSYEKMDELQQTVSMIAGNFEKKEPIKKGADEEVVVTTVGGEVEPLEETVETAANGEADSASLQTPEEESVQTEEVAENIESEEVANMDAEAQETATTPTEAESILAQGYYIVENGDSLESISTKIYGNNSHVEKMKEINKIENADAIFAGQKLMLP